MKLKFGSKYISVERKMISDFREKKLSKYHMKVDLPEDISVTFNSLYGHEHEKEVLQDIVDFFHGAPIIPHLSYYVYGPVGTGKSSLIFATGKEAGIPVISSEASLFSTMKDEEDINDILEFLFDTASHLQKIYGGVIIAFKNSEWIDQMENDSIFYSNLIRLANGSINTFMFMLTGSDEIFVPSEIIESEMFSTILTVDYPNLETREKIFEDCIKAEKLQLAKDVSINRLAKDALGFTPLQISYIVKEAYLYSQRQKHKEVSSSDFAETIDRLSVGAKTIKMTEKERISTAYHEAGHVVAGYYSDPEYVLKRVEISPRTQSLGLTQEDVDENKYSYFKGDYEKRIIVCLGGYAAEELKYGSHTSGVLVDLSMATTTAANMVKAYGMSKALGPMVVIPDVTDSGHTKALAEEETKKIVADLLEKTNTLMKTHEKALDALAHALLEKEVVNGEEIKAIFEKAEKHN